MPAAPVDEAGDLGGCFGLHARDHVGVLLEREGGRFVAEPFADDLDRKAGLQGKGRVRVAEVVEADGPQAGPWR
jgi:hypothetical protein